jgi:hypothetical protein
VTDEQFEKIILDIQNEKNWVQEGSRKSLRNMRSRG